MKAEIAQARDREHHSLNNVDDYLRVRRYTIGVDPAYVMLELGYDLPDEVFHHPVVAELRELAIQMIILDNVSRALPSFSPLTPSSGYVLV